MSDCIDTAQCAPVPSQAFPAPLPDNIPADAIQYAWDGVCPGASGLDACNGAAPISVATALDQLEGKLCTLNPKGISSAPNCSPIVVKNGVATPVSALEALNCLPDSVAGDVPIFNGSEWVIGPILLNPPDCEYPCPPAANLVLTSTGPNVATWQVPAAGAAPAALTALDSSSVNLTVAGSPTAPSITAAVVLDPSPNNVLLSGPNGLTYTPVPVTCAVVKSLITDPACVGTATDPIAQVLSLGTSGLAYRPAPSVSGISVADTPTVDLTQVGNNITGDVKISTNAGNAVTVTPTGLFVPLPGAAVAVTVSDTPTTDLTITGQTITATVKVSSTVNNRLAVDGTGLFVAPIDCLELTPLLDPNGGCFPNKTTAPTSVLSVGSDGLGYRSLPAGSAPPTVSDTPTIDLTQSGNNITGDVKVSTNAGNAVTVTPTGLFVPLPGAAVAVTVSDTPTTDLTITGQTITATVKVSSTLNNRLAVDGTGLFVAPIDCLELTPLLDPNGGCFPNKTTAPTSVLSIGSDGLGYRSLPAGSAPPTVSDTNTIDLTQSGNNITGDIKVSTNAGNAVSITPTGLFVPLPSAAVAVTVSDTATTDLTITGQDITATVKVSTDAGNTLVATPTGLFVPAASGGTTYTAVDTNSIDTTIAGNLISSDLKVDPIANNLLSVTSTGTRVLLDCQTVTTKISPSTVAGGCLPTIVSCNVPDAVLGHKAGVPGYYALGRELYQAEAYPTSVAASQTLSNTPSTLNDITTLMGLADESGLCGLASFWDPALSRFIITRPGRYTVTYGLFLRLIASNGTAANSGLYAGLRFIRPAGTVDGRSASGIATTLRGNQYTLNASVPSSTQDFHSVGSHTFLATAGTQLSLRAVFIAGGGATLSSFVTRGDSGHFSLSELPLRSYS